MCYYGASAPPPTHPHPHPHLPKCVPFLNPVADASRDPIFGRSRGAVSVPGPLGWCFGDLWGASAEVGKGPPPYPGRKLGYSGCLGEDNRRGQDKTEHTTRLVTPKGSADYGSLGCRSEVSFFSVLLYFKQFQTISNHFIKQVQTISNHFKPLHQTSSNHFKPFQTISNHFIKQAQTISNHFKPLH